MAVKKASVLFIDTLDKMIHFYSNNGASIVHETANYTAKSFENEFYTVFTGIVQDYVRKFPIATDTTVLLPDALIVNDLLTMPSMKAKAQKNTEETTLTGLFKDRKNIILQHENVISNKQFSCLYISGIRAQILSDLRAACNAARFVIRNISFPAESSVEALVTLNPKIKDPVYLFMDIKEKHTRIVYVYRGMSVGKTTLPFGYSVLEKGKMVQEDMLFDHPVAELAVLNAREKAQAKALSVMGGDNNAVAMSDSEGEGEEGQNSEGQETAASAEAPAGVSMAAAVRPAGTIKSLPRKTPRKLPKYMLRPTPDTEEGLVDENFRVFAKWALCYLQGNERLRNLGKCENVYVNMPKRFLHALDAINLEKEENRVNFVFSGIDEKDEKISANLELYGGLCIGSVRNSNIFPGAK